MHALRRQTTDLRKRLKDKDESPRELARQSEAKRKQSPQSEANVCRHNCTGHPTMLFVCRGLRTI